MDRDELKNKNDDLMNQYDKEEIDGDTYIDKMMKLTSSAKNKKRRRLKCIIYEIEGCCGQKIR